MNTQLTKRDLQAIEAQLDMELGERPTLHSLESQGIRDSATTKAIKFIADTGSIITLMIAEFIQSFAVLIIGVVFAVLEYQRVYAGSQALGQMDDKAALIAFAVVVANVVHPIYSLREHRNNANISITKQTARGMLSAFWGRIIGKPTTKTAEWSHNPVLHIGAMAITWTTILLATYDLIAPLLTSIIEGTSSKPGLIMAMELLAGLGLSVAGVFFLQSASHEIGVRTLTDKRQDVASILAEQQNAYDQRAIELRDRITRQRMQGKIEDAHRKDSNVSPELFAPVTVQLTKQGTNGNGHHNGATKDGM